MEYLSWRRTNILKSGVWRRISSMSTFWCNLSINSKMREQGGSRGFSSICQRRSARKTPNNAELTTKRWFADTVQFRQLWRTRPRRKRGGRKRSPEGVKEGGPRNPSRAKKLPSRILRKFPATVLKNTITAFQLSFAYNAKNRRSQSKTKTQAISQPINCTKAKQRAYK